jgi:DNA-binding transcriptional MerR regulator
MRKLPYITTGKILEELREESDLNIGRVTFYKLEKKGLFTSKKTAGGWRVYTRSDANLIKEIIKENYGLIDSVEKKA